MVKINVELLEKFLQESFTLIADINSKREKLNEAWIRENGSYSLYASLREYVEFKANCGSLFGLGDFFVWLFDDEGLSDARPWTLDKKHKKEYDSFLILL